MRVSSLFDEILAKDIQISQWSLPLFWGVQFLLFVWCRNGSRTDSASVLTSTNGNAKIGQSEPADLVGGGPVVRDFKMKVDKRELPTAA